MSATYSGGATSGVLTVSNGGSTVASIHLVGSYVTSDFALASGSGGSSTIITDPQVVGGGSIHSAEVTLFGNYMAAFVGPAGHDVGAPIAATMPQTPDQPPLLTHPHHHA